jgi:hypothetical protein
MGGSSARGVLVDAKSCGDHAGVNAGESGVWVDGDIVENPGERLLVYDQWLYVSHRDLKLKCSRCCLMNDMALGENRISSVCWARNAMYAWTDSLASARMSKQCWVCSSALVEGVLSLGIQRRRGWGTRGEPEVCAHSTVLRLCPPSGVGGGRAGDLDARPKGKCDGDKRRWMVVLWCVVLCLCCVCVVLCCVCVVFVLCCVVLGWVVLCWVVLGCVGLC